MNIPYSYRKAYKALTFSSTRTMKLIILAFMLIVALGALSMTFSAGLKYSLPPKINPSFVQGHWNREGRPKKCDKNEVFRPCFDGCEPTCDEPKVICPPSECQLEGGCACKQGYLCNRYDRCVPDTCVNETNDEYYDYLVY
ncbi:hypothetical protein Y032_0762g2138 [Ancylostoma ceylanicum]|uniref:TIL domain-containing protein n=1 Tax=Ancylostoma ceylanicum TaxID=53326 RepID=A0A016WFN8_9BILA|nr:hypothetical protein Y032_0762g2138 [Ancylostoma ceylanicum]